MNYKPLQELALNTAGILKEKNPRFPFLLVEHRVRIHPVTILVHNALSEQMMDEWKNSFQAQPSFSQPPSVFEADGWFYFLGLTEFGSFPFYFFVFNSEPPQNIQDLLEAWKKESRLLNDALRETAVAHETTQGNLISQLLHDVQAIMTLQPENSTNEALQTRLNYQQKVNENLLLFIRPLELLPSRLPLSDLIHSSMQMVNIPPQKYSLTISVSLAEIEVDAEFMARAIQEIVWNSLQAGAPSCTIHAKLIPAGSPFVTKDWLELSFSDSGSGISQDYLKSVTEPFFTTRKNEGHSGFGLALVKKIADAHGGYLTIESKKNQGTEVKLYIPV